MRHSRYINNYRPPIFVPGGHLQTIYPSLFRKLDPGIYTRERIITSDGDFLDLDWLKGTSKRLAIISHGMEGSSHRPYVLGMARALHKKDGMYWLGISARVVGK
jgi:uncharacterized protein